MRNQKSQTDKQQPLNSDKRIGSLTEMTQQRKACSASVTTVARMAAAVVFAFMRSFIRS